MQGQHPLADLAPRDVVARAIIRRMREAGTDHVYLDCRHLGAEFLEQRFPSIVQRCRELGFDPATELLPVAPAQHYASGGVRTDLRGRTSVEGLYACGETSCTGVHGANRLASNSLLEGLVFARRIADDLTARLGAGELPETTPIEPEGAPELIRGKRRLDVQRAMTAGAGTVRSAESLAATESRLAELAARAASDDAKKKGGPKSWETTNLLHLGRALAYAASLREETRGGHVREDFPVRDDERFLHHVHLVRSGYGTLTAETVDVPRSNLESLGLDPAGSEVTAAQGDPK
jgi:L-aspartate oxidase